ncbi:MAG TPA: TIGR03915 family putative DNA repair protein [Candidatus Omnitrophota bacterium]|nr:TIGR03915 family putative DNA repair protein [Candidatus Omnitrophota bacterium]HPB67380.1 TIGR03915 family putative DNA repair protein [Candidatus Omnitrophota bacterium]HQO57869.1 TIGR03915 family putative DNA repair protein [Candidatus Omnitrophota bacterium]HQP11860.1 TIGR03915 family putative DNA repair protein [Candidatus Omnitrophota bacterium]
MNRIYVYNGSFEGFLAALEVALQPGLPPEDIVPEKDFIPSLFAQAIKAEPCARRLHGFIERLKRDAPGVTLKKIFYTYLSDVPQRGMLAYRYLIFVFEHGHQAGRFLSEEAVSRVEDLSYKVSREAHRLKGFVRFKELADGVLYAAVEPDHNILPLISSHFVKRMRRERWVIHDVRRHLAAVNGDGVCRLVDIQLVCSPVYSGEEYDYQRLWREYFKTIAIESRLNPRLQRQFLPRRYWKYLVEMSAPARP